MRRVAASHTPGAKLGVRCESGTRRPIRTTIVSYGFPRRMVPMSDSASAPSWRPWLVTVARLGLAVVFGIAGIGKAVDPQATRLSVRAYQLVPDPVADLIGTVLPYAEIALALLLLVGLLTRWAAAATGVLLLSFVAGIASVWARGLSIDCGCFGGGLLVTGEVPSYPMEILRDLGLLVLAAACVAWPVSRLSLDAYLSPTSLSSTPIQEQIT